LHRVLIPLEVTAFVWLITTVALHCLDQRRWVMATLQSIVWTLGLLSWVVSAESYVGLVILTFHVLLGRFCTAHIPRLRLVTSAIIGTAVWTISWILQVVLGHYYIEGRPPNIGTDQVSLLSACTSVVLAWEV
jgi:uncharacterized membrane protein YGL010W